jgi:3-oxoacyl-(acyl-carrier-protein) synthase
MVECTTDMKGVWWHSYGTFNLFKVLISIIIMGKEDIPQSLHYDSYKKKK